jgi:hypothetical protein
LRSVHRLDTMIEMGARAICDPLHALDDLPRRLAAQWPDAPALELVVALASAADGVQSMFGEGGESGKRAARVWRQAAMVGADVHYLALSASRASTAADLLQLWESEMPRQGAA